MLRWRRSFANGLGRLASLPVLLLISMALVALLLLVSVPIPGVRGVSRAGARKLMELLGPTYAQILSPTTFDAEVSRASSHLDWLAERCRRVAVVAISQQVPVALELVRRQEPRLSRSPWNFGGGSIA